MTTHKEALKLALELLAVGTFHSPELQAKRTEVIQQGLNALAQPEQEPVGINGLTESETNATASVIGLVNTTPPQRKPLTVEQLREHWQVAKVLDMTDAEIDFADYVLIARDVEALYGIKGEA